MEADYLLLLPHPLQRRCQARTPRMAPHGKCATSRTALGQDDTSKAFEHYLHGGQSPNHAKPDHIAAGMATDAAVEYLSLPRGVLESWIPGVLGLGADVIIAYCLQALGLSRFVWFGFGTFVCLSCSIRVYVRTDVLAPRFHVGLFISPGTLALLLAGVPSGVGRECFRLSFSLRSTVYGLRV